MNWYERQLMAENRERELERAVELRRLQLESPHSGRGGTRPFHFWLISVLRAWIIGAA